MHVHTTYRPYTYGGYEKRTRGETRKAVVRCDEWGEKRESRSAGERASASEVETRGSCLAPGVPLFPQTVAPNATHLSRPTYRAILKPACIPGAGFPLSFLPTRVPARPSSSPRPAVDAAACVRRRAASFDGSTTRSARIPRSGNLRSTERLFDKQMIKT